MSPRRHVVVHSLRGQLPYVLAFAAAAAFVGTRAASTAERLTDAESALLIGGAVAAIPLVLLCIVAPLTAFALACFLLAVVRAEPAPVDVLFAVLMLTTSVSLRIRPQVPAIVLFPLAGFIVVSLISATNADEFSRAVRFELITLYLIVLAVWLSWIFTQARWLRVAVLAYVISAATFSVLTTLALAVPFPGSDALLYEGVRAMGLFKDPNVFGPFLIPAAAIAIDELLQPRLLPWSRPVSSALFCILSAATVLSFSRGAWVNLALTVAVVVLVHVFRRGGGRALLRAITVLGVAGLMGLSVLSLTGSLELLELRSGLQSYDTDRFGAQITAFDRATEHVFGHGPGQSEAALRISTHSFFARAVFEQGLLGLAILVAVLAATLYCSWIVVRRNVPSGVGSAALLGSWVGLIASSAVVDTVHWRIMWFVAALIWTSYLAGEAGQARRLAPAPPSPADVRRLLP